ncbi:hypothetical protein L484_013640 [Morus notabilis]|uniref:Wax synthase domain-containing protein n=1 Tax=Morus notabilis TaxID=981085 RepID=W9QX65_9ROSA|nr:hypothetical protein L484_013640 [Morus notabilis]
MSSKVEEELRNFSTVWIFVLASLCYCHFIAKIIKHGITRFVLILPVLILFFVLPLKLTTICLGGPTSFFIAWLATFKLILFSFGKGPLSSDPPHSMARFISFACFPVKLEENPTNSTTNGDDPNYPTPEKPVKKPAQKSLHSYLLKGIIFSSMFFVYQNKSSLHPKLFLLMYSVYTYTSLEVMLAIVAAIVRAYLGVELEPQFDDPYMATSVQDFWSRRWNIMVSKVLRPTVYVPVRTVSKHVVGNNWAAIPGVVAVFIVSGIMHEWIFYIIGRSKPTGEIGLFFVLQGVCMALEIIVKRMAHGKWRLPPRVSGTMAVSFVLVTAVWLFLPGMMRYNSDVMAYREMVGLIRYVKTLGSRLRLIEKGSNYSVFSSLHNRI